MVISTNHKDLKMEINLKLSLRDDIKSLDKEKSVYHSVWELKKSFNGITHIIEKYDDITEFPGYSLGYYENDSFIELASAEWGEPIDENKLNSGGVYIDIHLDNYTKIAFNKFS
jgi:hypothetical protein